MEFKFRGKFWPNELTNSINSFRNGIIEIVDDWDSETFLEQLNCSVGSDESSSAGNKDMRKSSGHGNFRHANRDSLLEKKERMETKEEDGVR